jgi:hypothetical protein
MRIEVIKKHSHKKHVFLEGQIIEVDNLLGTASIIGGWGRLADEPPQEPQGCPTSRIEAEEEEE